MTSRRLRIVLGLAVCVGAAGIAAPLAQQRGGSYRQSYTGNVRYDGRFVFVRMSYPWSGGRGAPWAHDYPTGEEHFMKILTAVSNVGAHVEASSIMSFGDPELFKFPVVYLCEPGYWSMSDEEVVALRSYLQKGGFMIADDFPSWAWGNFDVQMSKVFPRAEWRELTPQHPIFHSFFEIDSFDIIPQAYNLGGRPRFMALFEDNDENKRMYVIANFQQDLSEFWEYSETGFYMVQNTNEAYKIGVNQFIYGLTH